MIRLERLADKVFGIIRGFKYEVKMYSPDGDEIIDPQMATRFFIVEPSIMVTIDSEEGELEISISSDETFNETRRLQQNLKQLANEFLLNYTVRNHNKQIEPRDFSYKAKIHKVRQMKDEQMSESISRMYGSKKTSYQQVESVKLLVKHKTEVDEDVRGSRTRNIKEIFIERGGERFKFQSNHLPGARAMARHMSYGGAMDDQVGNYISECSQRLIQLREFVRYAKSNQLVNEDNARILSVVSDNVTDINEDLKRLAGTNSYRTVAERIKSSVPSELNEDQSGFNVDELKDMFTVKRFNEEFEKILPLVNHMVAERNQSLRKVEEASQQSIYISGNVNLSEQSVIEFENPQAQLGYKINSIASTIEENEDLVSFVKSVGNKMQKNEEVNAFEQQILSNVLENLVVRTPQSLAIGINESVEFEKFLDRYTRIS